MIGSFGAAAACLVRMKATALAYRGHCPQSIAVTWGAGSRRRSAATKAKAAAELGLVHVLITQDARFSHVRCASESGARADIR